jgi:hypothetical protein
MYVCVYIYIYIYMCVCILYIYTHTHTHTHTHTCTHAFIGTFIAFVDSILQFTREHISCALSNYYTKPSDKNNNSEVNSLLQFSVSVRYTYRHDVLVYGSKS